jgi:hypothetical protein
MAIQRRQAILVAMKQRFRLDFPKYARKIARHSKRRWPIAV